MFNERMEKRVEDKEISDRQRKDVADRLDSIKAHIKDGPLQECSGERLKAIRTAIIARPVRRWVPKLDKKTGSHFLSTQTGRSQSPSQPSMGG